MESNITLSFIETDSIFQLKIAIAAELYTLKNQVGKSRRQNFYFKILKGCEVLMHHIRELSPVFHSLQLKSRSLRIIQIVMLQMPR